MTSIVLACGGRAATNTAAHQHITFFPDEHVGTTFVDHALNHPRFQARSFIESALIHDPTHDFFSRLEGHHWKRDRTMGRMDAAENGYVLKEGINHDGRPGRTTRHGRRPDGDTAAVRAGTPSIAPERSSRRGDMASANGKKHAGRYDRSA